MSNFIWNSHLSYRDYLQAKSFISDVTSATRSAGKQVSMEISRQTRDVIASNEALQMEHVAMVEASTDRTVGALNEGFDRLSYSMDAGFDRLSNGLDQISSGISELNATFHWGFGEIIASLGHMNDSLSELIKIAKTPVQTVAFNHFEIARDAFRQGLYKESLEELEKAISGDHTSAGYKLEWRFHQMKGTLHLGFADGDMSLLDLAKAEETFLMAARYGKADYPKDAGRAFLSAGWAAYCQGKMKEALAHTEQAMALHPKMGEAFFQAAKIHMSLGQVDTALPVLSKAIDLDQFYALKAASDGDFQPYDEKLRSFLEALRIEKYRQSVPKVQAALEKIRFWREHFPAARNNEAVSRMDAFIEKGGTWPLLDMLSVVQKLDETISGIEKMANQSRIVVTATQTVNGVRDDICDGIGKTIASLEFCPIHAGKFMMGENKKKQVTLMNDFFLGKYQVTQAQWQAVMGNNPSHFKGASLPVEKVSWDDCQRFIQKLNSLSGKQIYRLPTEAEWEYACRAGSTTAYCYGDDEGRLGEYAWYNGNSGNTTHPVGQKKSNAWGLYDMHGNVGEWCQDWYGDLSAVSATDPKGASSGQFRVLRGGAWDRFANLTCATYRITSSPGIMCNYYGFRLARTK